MRKTWLGVALLIALSGCEGRIITTPTPEERPPQQPPVIVSFTADATRLGPPNGALLNTFLRWDVIGDATTRCRIDSFAQPSQTIGNVPLGGFVEVRPQVSRDYALSCSNPAGSAIRFVSILVG